MAEDNKVQNEEPVTQDYQKPVLTRWGTLRELTLGGGGTRNEPSKSKTRF